MGPLSNRQSILRLTSARAAVAQQGLTQHITLRPVSGWFIAVHLGIGRDHAATVDVLHRQLPAPVSAGVAYFYQDPKDFSQVAGPWSTAAVQNSLRFRP